MILSKNLPHYPHTLTLPSHTTETVPSAQSPLLAEFRHIIMQMRVQRVQCCHMAFLLYGHLPIHIAPKCVKAQTHCLLNL